MDWGWACGRGLDEGGHLVETATLGFDGAFDGGGEFDELLAQGEHGGDVELEPLLQASRDVSGLVAQRPTGRGERNEDAALVLGIAVPLNQPGLLQSLQQRGERAAVKAKAVAQRPDRDRFRFLPKGQHGHVLRVGEPEWLEQRPVGADQRSTGVVERKTQQLVQAELRRVHRHTLEASTDQS